MTIDISWNEIETIERNCFKDAPHLKVVKFNNNEIYYVAILGFYNLKNLVILSTKFSVTIDISWNEIETIERNCFKDAPHLKVVKFNNNEIYYVAILGFYNLKNLVILDLSHNMIQMIHSSVFLDIPKLEAIILQNYITESNAYKSLFEVTIKIIQTDDFHLCCAINRKTIYV